MIRVREELALYYSSVRRADGLGAVLDALEKADEETMVVFLSDHGMPLPCQDPALSPQHENSAHSVWVTQAGKVDKRHMVSVVDLLPTILETLGLAPPNARTAVLFSLF